MAGRSRKTQERADSTRWAPTGSPPATEPRATQLALPRRWRFRRSRLSLRGCGLAALGFCCFRGWRRVAFAGGGFCLVATAIERIEIGGALHCGGRFPFRLIQFGGRLCFEQAAHSLDLRFPLGGGTRDRAERIIRR